jgi:hypothetical protein
LSEFPKQLFVTLEPDGDETYRLTHDSKVNAFDKEGETKEVATYELKHIDTLKLKKSVRLVAA